MNADKGASGAGSDAGEAVGAGRADARSRLGMAEWFRPGEEERVEFVLERLRRAGVERLRTGVCLAGGQAAEGVEWYDWLLPRLAREVEILPCFVHAPPDALESGSGASPARDPKAYADFLEAMIDRHGERFEWVELWNEPDSSLHWDGRLAPDWTFFCRMIGGAAKRARQRGKKIVLAGPNPMDPKWLALMGRRGVLDHVDAVGVRAFPGFWERRWPGWGEHLAGVRRILDEQGSRARIWIAECGHSTWRRDEMRQVEAFLDAVDAPAERVYWRAIQDLDPEADGREGGRVDERLCRMGGLQADGTPKLLWRLLEQGGVEALRRLRAQTGSSAGVARSALSPLPAVVITGGAGFVGANLADRLAKSGRRVIVYDTLSRPGSEENLHWLKERHGERVRAEIADVRDPHALRQAVRQAAHVFHFAAQPSVAASLTDPISDFEVNARGALNLLEAARSRRDPPSIVFSSTSKVYGKLGDMRLIETSARWRPMNSDLNERGVSESRPLDLHGPHGCSKGAADAYVLDYARVYGLRATVLRLGCVYGPRQSGVEDQGWVTHFLGRGLSGQDVTIFGDGKQVRDVLYVDDLVDALLLTLVCADKVRGRAFNIGGGPANAISLLDLLELMREADCAPSKVHFRDWRVGDQAWFVSDISAFGQATGWAPRVSVRDGVARLMAWLAENRFPGRAAPRLRPARFSPRPRRERVGVPPLRERRVAP